ncbi:MAG: molybdenum cofactor guanylyltransferase [Ignavibacteria bacterium]
MFKDITAIVLAGGKSKRMGKEKALLPIGNKSIIQVLVEKLKELFPKVILSTNSPENFVFLHIPMVEDFYKNMGPLSGVHAGLIETETEKNFIISCDLPLMNKEMIEYICNYKSDKKIVVCKVGDYIEPTFGIYSKSIVDEIEVILNLNLQQGLSPRDISIQNVIEKLGAEIIDPSSLPFYNEDLFYNMNSFEDYIYVTKKLGLDNSQKIKA